MQGTGPSEEIKSGDGMMNATQLKNAKIDAISVLQAKYNRFSKSLTTPGVDKIAIQNVLDRVSKQISELKTELALIGS